MEGTSQNGYTSGPSAEFKGGKRYKRHKSLTTEKRNRFP